MPGGSITEVLPRASELSVLGAEAVHVSEAPSSRLEGLARYGLSAKAQALELNVHGTSTFFLPQLADLRRCVIPPAVPPPVMARCQRVAYDCRCPGLCRRPESIWLSVVNMCACVSWGW